MTKVYFIGAGPGDPELLTIKGKKIIEKADILIYAGSLVNKEVLEYNKKNAKTYNSALMTLDEVIKIYSDNKNKDIIIARIHTGDPALYGAIREQMDELKKLSIEYEVIPGISSVFAAAASLKKEFTLPDISQTLICTRLEGKTPVPASENLDQLAVHKSSMAIFLSVQMIDNVVKKLSKHYEKNTPIAVVQRASWKDEKIIFGTLADISSKVKKADIKKTAIILIGNFLGDKYKKSKLYDKNFSHEYRK
jgi:precorrin-4/cobalt-precorrin-4 C11-methyltransferase